MGNPPVNSSEIRNLQLITQQRLKALPWLARKPFSGEAQALCHSSGGKNQTFYATYTIPRPWEVRGSSNEPPGLAVASPDRFSLGRGFSKSSDEKLSIEELNRLGFSINNSTEDQKPRKRKYKDRRKRGAYLTSHYTNVVSYTWS